MNKDNAEKLCEQILEWCVQNFGESQYYDEPPLVIVETVLDKHHKLIKGEYDPYENIMWISSFNNRSIRQYALTVMHEYTHYKQYSPWIRRYLNMYGHAKSPYEQSAEGFAQNHIKECMKFLNR